MHGRDNGGKHDQMHYILVDPEKKKNETKGIGGILTSLLRDLFKELKVEEGLFNKLCADYIRHARFGLNDKVANYLSRGNLRRQLSDPKLTWKTFVKGLKLLGVRRFKISVEVYFRNGAPPCTVSREVDIMSARLFEESDGGGSGDDK